jgi:hypothetical protein
VTLLFKDLLLPYSGVVRILGKADQIGFKTDPDPTYYRMLSQINADPCGKNYSLGLEPGSTTLVTYYRTVSLLSTWVQPGMCPDPEEGLAQAAGKRNCRCCNLKGTKNRCEIRAKHGLA